MCGDRGASEWGGRMGERRGAGLGRAMSGGGAVGRW